MSYMGDIQELQGQIDDLYAKYQEGPKLNELPLAALERHMIGKLRPNADAFLQRGTVGPDALSDGAVGTDQFAGGPTARIYRTTNQSIAHDTVTNISFDAERWDDGDCFPGSGEDLFAPIAGIYLVMFHFRFAGNATGIRQGFIWHTGESASPVSVQMAVPGTSTWRASMTTVVQADAGDHFEFGVYQNSTVSLNVLTAGNASPEAALIWLRPKVA